jgi:hypothetical protein
MKTFEWVMTVVLSLGIIGAALLSVQLAQRHRDIGGEMVQAVRTRQQIISRLEVLQAHVDVMSRPVRLRDMTVSMGLGEARQTHWLVTNRADQR